MTNLIFGTSGWFYDEWVGPFYENEKNKFTFYTNYFGTTEINSTFYRCPTKQMVYGWYKTSPKDFRFSAKLPQMITHKKKMRLEAKVENDLLQFLELMNPLKTSNKLGPLLIQLPPSFTFGNGYESLSSFMEILPNDHCYAIEFRDYSWMRDETWRLLEKNNVAYTIVDEPLLPPDPHVTADFSYFRWHGRGEKLWYDYHYKMEELVPWIPRVNAVAEKVEKIYGYFNNHFHGYAVENCIQILEMLGQATDEQVKIKNKIIEHNKAKRSQPRQRRL